MADLRCPMCGKPNPEELAVCKFCSARLKPLVAPSPDDRPPIHPGEEPVRRTTSEMKRGTSPFGTAESIQAGDVPTRKNTSELERALPSWLRDLRGQEGQPAQPFADEGWPFPAAAEAAPQPADAKLPDWLSGMEGGAKEEEEVPDWLASIREKTPAPPAAPAEEEAFPSGGDTDWLGRLNQEEKEKPAKAAGAVSPFATGGAPLPSAGTGGMPDWMPELGSAPAQPAPPAPPAPAEAKPAGEMPTWMADLRAEPAQGPSEAQPAPADELPDWLMKLQAESKTPTHELPKIDVPFEESPDWLAKLQASVYADEKKPPAPETGLQDWFAETPPAPSFPGRAAVGALEPSPETAPAAETPDWLKDLPPIIAREAEAPAAAAFTPEAAAPAEVPDWLAQYQAGSAAAAVPTQPAATPPVTEPPRTMPGWLAEFAEAAAPLEASLPAAPQEAAPPSFERAASLPLETPDWLAALKPEAGEKKVPAAAPAAPPEIAAAELPTWVQAMRPVEAVVAEGQAAQEEKEVTALGGPLAGLAGVLPLTPGLGVLRKPPAYSARLQMTEGQQRHAASLERLVAAENEPRPIAGQARLRSASLLRWIIALLLILAVGLPLATGAQVVPAAVYPSELGATRELITGLEASPAVLLIFDYEPALSGELEAAAAPVIEHLLFKGPRLAILSTSPTGPILAESFMRKVPAPPEYVNLGYLAGGPAGVLGFAESPPDVATYTLAGANAWQTPTLQGVQQLNDFAAVILLTDNADTGRAWIEQAGPRLDTTPLIMVISAQAEPMIRPYYDSGQVRGLVTGLAGGKAYEQANEAAFTGMGLARRYWNAFSSGLLAAEALIVLGGLWSFFEAWRARRTQAKEGA
jgi:hypothetical protein